jgi:hypothetical protein
VDNDDVKELKADFKALIASQHDLAKGQAVIVAQYAASERATESFRQNLDAKFGDLATKSEVQVLRNDLAELKDDRKWLIKSIIGAWIAGLLGVGGIVIRKLS